MGETKNHQEDLQITNYLTIFQILEAAYKKNTESVEQIANNLEEIKVKQNDLKKDLLSFKSNTQAAIKALKASQQAIREGLDFMNKKFE